MCAVRYRPQRARHSHADAPDTTREFERLTALPQGPEREELSSRIVEAWLPMAHRLAAKYRSRGESLEDLEQVAALGLVKAVDRYDPSHGTPFVPFAVPTITGEIRRHFRDHTWDVHVPRRVQELRNKVRTAIRELSSAVDDHTPSAERIAAHTGLSQEDVEAGLEAIGSFRSLSLDASTGDSDDGFSLADTFGHSEPDYETVVAKEAVKPCLRDLPERQRRVLYMRFFRDMTQSRIGKELGISQMHVSRLLSKSFEHVRHQVEHDRRPARPRCAAGARTARA
ncbi:SigB/SigF/SigG family RNA polymerase sigma factor [Streptomyces tubbatahanensis]|uniref:SigB/SigF/SigG family RNA polymerase sigma factor n=1 Tax=Streptomyces tubbatahanensis TaxID=2923272 RepID=A0ABY3Y0Y6_9ACTN|nr:SigB/SigF/SigG family RNA polymerase sigma factor [Streptomyces tubbatahanensis]UNT00259.1 SigB/SigF/SigG family RNA polymerase sigma factor [Streptomyces tubbatahanensis]